MYINEDIDFNNIQDNTTIDNFVNDLTADVIIKQICKEINKIDLGVFLNHTNKSVKDCVVYNKHLHRIEVLGEFSISGNKIIRLPEWCPYVYFIQIAISGIEQLSNIENLPQNCRTLKIEGSLIESLEGMPEHVSELRIWNCQYIQDLTGISNDVKTLRIGHCDKFRSLEGGEKLELVLLSLHNLTNLHSFYGLNHHVVHITLSNIQIYTPTHIICANLDLSHYAVIDETLLTHLPKCRKLLIYHSLLRSLKGIDDDIKELYIENDLDCAGFILEEHLPWNLEVLGINLYFTDRNHFNRFNNSFEFPDTLQKVLLSTHCTHELKKYIKSKTDAFIDILYPVSIPQ